MTMTGRQWEAGLILREPSKKRKWIAKKKSHRIQAGIELETLCICSTHSAIWATVLWYRSLAIMKWFQLGGVNCFIFILFLSWTINCFKTFLISNFLSARIQVLEICLFVFLFACLFVCLFVGLLILPSGAGY